jgi:hypothetical protein
VTGEGKIGIAATVVALVALAVAVAVAAGATIVIRHDRARIHTLQRQVAALCARRVVTGVATPGLGRVTVQTQKGC